MRRFNRTASVMLIAVIVVTALAGVPISGANTTAWTAGDDEYSVVQGDRCIPIEPLGDGTQSVEEFYDYRNPATEPSSYSYSSFGTTHLQEDDTSALALYEGNDGLSLVLVHDRLEGNTDGGAVTMEFENLPENGEWVVEDDNYSVDDGPEILDNADATWEHGDTWSRITWTWTEARTDGGAFNGGLEDDFSIEVTPAFNDAADYHVFDGEVTDWEVLSAPESDPQRTALEMDEPIEIRSEGCTAITDLEVNDSVPAGDDLEATATVVNDGIYEDTVTVPFVVDGELVDEREVTVAANATATVSTTLSFDDAGEAVLSAGEERATVTVTELGPIDRLPGFGIVIGGIALVATLLAVRTRE